MIVFTLLSLIPLILADPTGEDFLRLWKGRETDLPSLPDTLRVIVPTAAIGEQRIGLDGVETIHKLEAIEQEMGMRYQKGQEMEIQMSKRSFALNMPSKTQRQEFIGQIQDEARDKQEADRKHRHFIQHSGKNNG
jgi:hypothetical protein